MKLNLFACMCVRPPGPAYGAAKVGIADMSGSRLADHRPGRLADPGGIPGQRQGGHRDRDRRSQVVARRARVAVFPQARPDASGRDGRRPSRWPAWTWRLRVTRICQSGGNGGVPWRAYLTPRARASEVISWVHTETPGPEVGAFATPRLCRRGLPGASCLGAYS
jgi:hypothetical protein